MPAASAMARQNNPKLITKQPMQTKYKQYRQLIISKHFTKMIPSKANKAKVIAVPYKANEYVMLKASIEFSRLIMF